MTCDSDLASSPSVLDDPDSTGKILYWQCCGRSWYLSPTDSAFDHSGLAWHYAAEALKPVNC